MRKNKSMLPMNLRTFGFDPDTVTMQDSMTGKIPTSSGITIIDKFSTDSVITRFGKREDTLGKYEHDITYLDEGVSAYWVDEGQPIGTSSPKWKTERLSVKKLGVLVPITSEALKTSVSNFFTIMANDIADAFTIQFDLASLFGVSSPFGTGKSIYEKVKATGNEIILGTNGNLYDDLNDVMGLIEAKDYMPNGIVTTKKMNMALRGTKDTSDRPIFNEAIKGETAEALGLPISYAQAQSWDNDKSQLLIGDWDKVRYAQVGDIEYKISDQATLNIKDDKGQYFNLFERDALVLRAIMHIGFVVLKDDAFGSLAPQKIEG